jgi:hypothetical protein
MQIRLSMKKSKETVLKDVSVMYVEPSIVFLVLIYCSVLDRTIDIDFII